MCGITTKDQVHLQDLLERMQLDNMEKVLHNRRLRWRSKIECSDGWL